MRTTPLILMTLVIGFAFGKEAPDFFNKKHAPAVKMRSTKRVATGKQLKESALRKEWEPKLNAVAKSHQATAKAFLRYRQQTSATKQPSAKKQVPTQVDQIKRILRSASQWRHAFYSGAESNFQNTSLRDVPVVTINGLSAATISPGEVITVSVNFGSGVDSALVDVFYDVDGDTVVDSAEISLLSISFPNDGGPQGPFWIYDNDTEDEDPTIGVYTTTIDDLPLWE